MQLIGTFRIVPDQPEARARKGQLQACDEQKSPGIPQRLVLHKNYKGYSYEENHLEEWIARQPSAIFGENPVLLIASQNYLHLRVKIDLLFIDAAACLYPVELKVVPVAKNGGVVPFDLYTRQMKPYVDFLTGINLSTGLAVHYQGFHELFSQQHRELNQDFISTFGKPLPAYSSVPICEVYVAEGFDAFSLDYFKRKSQEDGRSVRLIQYKFYPDRNCLEFWNAFEAIGGNDAV